MRRSLSLYLLFISFFILRVLLASQFLNMHWPDEIFQTLEQAHRLMFTGITPWEFSVGARNYLLPAFLSIFVYLGSFLGPGSWGYTHLIYLLLCGLSLVPLIYFYKSVKSEKNFWTVFFLLFALGNVSYFIYMSPKAFSEVISAHIFFFALILYDGSRPPEKRTTHLLLGFLLGTVCVLRIHYSIPVAILSLYGLYKRHLLFLPLILGFLSITIFAGFLDALTWEYFFSSYITHFKINILDGLASWVASSPWNGYWTLLQESFYFVGLSIASLFFYRGFKTKTLLGILCLSIFISHSFISHKEVRFVYLGTLLFFILATHGTLLLLEDYKHSRWILPGILLAWTLTLLCSYDGMKKEYYRGRGFLESFRKMSTDEYVCGIGISKIHIDFLGGYYFLHKDVPLFVFGNNKETALKKINRILAEKESFPLKDFPLYTVDECYEKICLFRRDGECN